MRNPFAKTLSGNLSCPHCESGAVRFVEDRGPYEKRYRCTKCGGYFRYQYRNKPLDNDTKPYSGHTRGIDLAGAMRFFGRYKR